ncbi:RHS repeat-associated core domain-containing protein [Dyella sp. 2RAB6]|uniref:RHS repeat-associated core domain-containing protein n=1 Tax=Dyella sp. 2RAB6 TaxID=3232992 RepID=UPI003F8E4EEE
MTLRSAALVAALALLAACSNGTAPAASTRTAPAAASTVPAVAAAPAPPPYALEGTEVRELPSKILGRDYQLDVYLPDSYAQESKRSYPVVFVTDAPYAFPLIRSIARRVGDHGDGLRDFILIGLSYAKGDTPKYSRNRDYTPTAKGPSSADSDMPGRAPLYGEAESYRRFIAEEVFPFVASHYRALGNAPGANPAVETYSYDPLYRLTGLKDAQGQAIEAYTYNKTGDRLSKTANGLATGTYGYQAGTHWLTSIGSNARTYDANGNTTGSATGGDTFGYGYNDRNRMTVVQRNGQTVASYIYNAMGERVLKAAADNQRFAYNERSQLLGEYGAASRSYVWLDSLPVAIVDTNGAASTVSYVHADALGTPRVVTDGTGAAVWQWSYQANSFGEKAPSTASMALNLRYPGQYFDAESWLAYNVNRYYEPKTGRYGQSDPLGLDGGLTTYLYVNGSPLVASDPLGLIGPQQTTIQNKIEVAIARGDTETLETLLEVANPEQQALIRKALTPARDLIRASLKRSGSYASELEGETYADLCKLARSGGALGNKAQKMKKLIDAEMRLMEKVR